MFGQPVSLQYKGKQHINTDFGAFCSLIIKITLLVYAAWLA